MSLKSLGLDYVDLYLLHWPIAMNPEGIAAPILSIHPTNEPFLTQQSAGNHEKFPKLPDGSRDLVKDWSHIKTWKLMEKLLATGKVKAIGVCNYSVRYLEELLPHVIVTPAVNQIENHPSLPQQEIVDYCKSKGIHVTAYSPLGSSGSPMLKEKSIIEVAEKKGVTPASILLSYHSKFVLHLQKEMLTSAVARGNSVLAKSVNPERIKANREIVKLDESDMKVLNDYTAALTKEGKLTRYVYPAFGVDFGFPDKPGGIILRP